MNTFKNKAEKSTSKLKSVHAEKIGELSRELSQMRSNLPAIDKMKVDMNHSVLHKGKVLVAAKDINFSYHESQPLWKEPLSFEIISSGRFAIDGSNGSGKTTLIKLLAGLYDVKEGDIKLNETAISDIDMAGYRTNSVFLFQDFEKYFLSIEENITLGTGTKDISDEAVERAARLAQAHDFIVKLSRGYKTRIGRHFKESEQLSGGQWQKIALSRVFYRDAKLIVLDEPTSSLDPNAEFKVFENLKNNLKDQVVIVVTHRLYNLKIADYIYVLKDGKISQEGDFETLTNADGEFRTMYNNQKL